MEVDRKAYARIAPAAHVAGLRLAGDIRPAGERRVRADRIELRAYTAPPTLVLRDAVPTSSWSYSASLDELTLIEVNGGSHEWQVVP